MEGPLEDLSFLDAIPTAELEPITETYVQSDEVLVFLYSLIGSIDYPDLG